LSGTVASGLSVARQLCYLQRLMVLRWISRSGDFGGMFFHQGKPYFLHFGRLIGGHLSKYVTVSVKLSHELKEKLEKLGIKPSKLLRKAIEEELRRREVERIKAEIMDLKPVLDRISAKEVVKSIREYRESR